MNATDNHTGLVQPRVTLPTNKQGCQGHEDKDLANYFSMSEKKIIRGSSFGLFYREN
jgi:hypothetical protein